MAITVETNDLGNEVEEDFQQEHEGLQGSDPWSISCNSLQF